MVTTAEAGTGTLNSPAAPGVPTPASGPIVVVVQGHSDQAPEAGRSLGDSLRRRFSPLEPLVFVSVLRGTQVELAPLESALEMAAPAMAATSAPAASQGAIPGQLSPVGPLLRDGVARGASALVIVAAEAHDASVDWLDALVSPVLEGGIDFVCPAYVRHRCDGAINTGIVAPLVRLIYGCALRQPLGTEAALSPGLARRLLADPDWHRRPLEAGSDAWLLAKTLSGTERVAQSWLGAWPRPVGPPESLSDTLVRALGLVFTEMERTADQWQRRVAPRVVDTYGRPGFEVGGVPPEPGPLFEAFRLGLRDLLPVWGLVLPPATLLELQRCAALPVDAGGITDALWARVIIDFAVAHMTRVVERRQLLRSLAPLYQGWLAGLAHAARVMDEVAFEARVEATAAAFESEKRYLVARWRWPDQFNP